MDDYRKWFFWALGIWVGIVGLIGLANYILDPYGLLRKDFTYQFVEPDKNFIKIRYISRNPDRYDSFIFGSSRVNNMNVRKIRGYNCYNVHYSGGLPRDHLDNIKYLLNKGVKPKLILIGLDEFSFRDDPNARLRQPLRYPYPPVLNQPTFLYYLRYFFSFTDWEIMQQVLKGFKKKLLSKPGEAIDFYNMDMFDTGQMSFSQVDRKIEENPEAHRNDQKFLTHGTSSGDHLKEAIKDLREIVHLTKANQIRLVLFFNPLHKIVFLDCGADFDRFKRALSQTTGFYDFSGLNSITTDNYNYYETSHYRPLVGDLMIARIFNDQKIKVPEDFGQWVTSENIDHHLETLRQKVKK